MGEVRVGAEMQVRADASTAWLMASETTSLTAGSCGWRSQTGAAQLLFKIDLEEGFLIVLTEQDVGDLLAEIDRQGPPAVVQTRLICDGVGNTC